MLLINGVGVVLAFKQIDHSFILFVRKTVKVGILWKIVLIQKVSMSYYVSAKQILLKNIVKLVDLLQKKI